MATDEVSRLADEVIAFRDARDWAQFHTLKDNALSVLIEAAELAEVVRWKPEDEVDSQRLEEELADVFYWLLLTAHDRKIDLAAALRTKLVRNAQRYPVELAKGNASKYTEL